MLSSSLEAGIDIRFHCVYLLTSLDPHCEGEYYVGYTVNPLRRLRQHNGELMHGARRTSRRGRPWTLVCCVSGFTEDRVALKFEWCWQHPLESARLKHMTALWPALQPLARRLPYAVAVLHLLLLRAELFARLELTVHIFDSDRFARALAEAQATLQRMSLHTKRGAAAAAARQSATQPVSCSDNVLLPSLPSSSSSSSPSSSSSLLHVEYTTTRAFEDKYLSHDRCLHLRDDTCSMACSYGEGESELSCPYDLQALSQSVWVDASMTHTSVAAQQEEDDDEEEENNSKSETDAVRPVPRRFCFYGPAEYAAVYMWEQRLLKLGRLPCTLCALPLHSVYVMRCPRQPHCALRAHIACLAMWFDYHNTYGMEEKKKTRDEQGTKDDADDIATVEEREEVRLVPVRPCACPLCGTKLYWASLVRALKQRAAYDLRLTQRERRAKMERCWRQRLAKMAAQHHGRRRAARSAPRCIADTHNPRNNSIVQPPLPPPSQEEGGAVRRGVTGMSAMALTQPCHRTAAVTAELTESSLVGCITHEETRMYTRVQQETNSTTSNTCLAEPQPQAQAKQQQESVLSHEPRPALLGLTEFDEEEWLSY